MNPVITIYQPSSSIGVTRFARDFGGITQQLDWDRVGIDFWRDYSTIRLGWILGWIDYQDIVGSKTSLTKSRVGMDWIRRDSHSTISYARAKREHLLKELLLLQLSLFCSRASINN